MTVARNRSALRLGKGTAFVKTRLKRLRQEDETWEGDFCALPKPHSQTATYYVGLVVTQPHGFLLASEEIKGRPTVNHLATLLAHAMQRPLVEGAHRPRRILLRGHRQWQELFPHLTELGIEVTVQTKLPQVEDTYEDYLRQVHEPHRGNLIEPSAEPLGVETLFPTVAKWVRGYGHIEIGDQEGFGFVARVLDYGGLVFEDGKSQTLAEAMAALENVLADYFEREGIG